MLKRLIDYFSRTELILWSSSVLLIVVSRLAFGAGDTLSLVASLIGVTALIINAKGNPIGQVLVIIFSILYAYVSYDCAYYGEMITYAAMTGPMAVVALVAWLRNPYGNNHAEVRINRISGREVVLALALTAAVTTAFYFILAAFNTAFLTVSTLSVATSFFAVYLSARRSPYFAIAYALNDIVLIILWTVAALSEPKYVPVIVCFVAFFANDIYCFYNWRRIEKRQNTAE